MAMVVGFDSAPRYVRSTSQSSPNEISRPLAKSHPTSATPAPRARIIDSDGAVIGTNVEKPVIDNPPKQSGFPIKPRISKVLQEIGDLDFSTSRSQTIEDVDAATWDELQANHRESMSHRLEYSVDLKAVIVTCASGVHESFKAICEPFLRVAAASPFLDFETNRDIDIPSPTGGHSTRVPDFAFVNKVDSTDPAYPFILECSWSQPFREVEAKAHLWLTLAHVKAVVCIDIQERRTQEPYPSPSNLDKEYKLANPAEFRRRRGTRLTPVEFQGRLWAREIEAIKVHIFQRGNIQAIDIMPTLPSVELEENQERIELFLGEFLSKYASEAFAQLFSADNPFYLNWDTFYDDLDARLVADGYKRYKAWADMGREDPAIVRSLAPEAPIQLAAKRERDEETTPSWYKTKKQRTGAE
ncbi:hypothetical protein DFH08DRAFT_1086578 [Mycena albidolilacea]|uniref:Uncharacterized protein n=1 Tax=Mycena albidolilacea TaxID=1033008 RepID=A0AAD7EEK7_9AGAR|nr:hypothetical protein DFH08DRAFT_1086578 [Mycena albidolilacea]